MSAAAMRGIAPPRLSRIIGPASARARDPLTLAAGVLTIATTVLALHAALGLVFDPRYKDFPFAPLTAAVVPLLMLGLTQRPQGERGAAELAAAAALALSAAYIAVNESFANWQSLWFCAALGALAFSLFRVRGAPD
jgi:glucan 1,3-beta-glucosidase